MTQDRPEVGKWYEHNHPGAIDRYVVGFREDGRVVLQGTNGDLTHCDLKYFHDNYKKKPEIIRKYLNVYLYNRSLFASGALYDTEEKAKAKSGTTNYIGTYPVDIKLP